MSRRVGRGRAAAIRGVALALSVGAVLFAGGGVPAPAGAQEDDGTGTGRIEVPATPVPDIQPGERPDPASPEAGLWMRVNRIEANIRTAGNRIQDAALTDYVGSIVCKLAGPYCPDIRTYVLRVPGFNASMMPNGVMQVWSGLLLRMRDEAQLATILGHEVGHYIRRHSIQELLDKRQSRGFLLIFSLGVGVAGLPDLADSALLLSEWRMAAYGRDYEREADRLGAIRLYDAGYDPRAAPEVWGRAIRENSAAQNLAEYSLLASHPPSAERMESLAAFAEELIGDGPPGERHVERFRAVLAPWRFQFLTDEVSRRSGRIFPLLEMLLEDDWRQGEVQYFVAELARRFGSDDEVRDEALHLFEGARGMEGTPPELHRSLGLLYLRMKRPEAARSAFAEYLRLRPEASDREMVRAMMTKGEK